MCLPLYSSCARPSTYSCTAYRLTAAPLCPQGALHPAEPVGAPDQHGAFAEHFSPVITAVSLRTRNPRRSLRFLLVWLPPNYLCHRSLCRLVPSLPTPASSLLPPLGPAAAPSRRRPKHARVMLSTPSGLTQWELCVLYPRWTGTPQSWRRTRGGRRRRTAEPRCCGDLLQRQPSELSCVQLTSLRTIMCTTLTSLRARSAAVARARCPLRAAELSSSGARRGAYVIYIQVQKCMVCVPFLPRPHSVRRTGQRQRE